MWSESWSRHLAKTIRGDRSAAGRPPRAFSASRRFVFRASSLVGHHLASRLTSVRESERDVAVQQVLLRLRVRVGVLLRLALLPDVLRLPVAAAAVPAAEAAGGLRRRRRLRRRARVRRVRSGVVRRRLVGRARAAVDVAPGDVQGNVGVDRVLLGLRVGVGVLLGLGRLDRRSDSWPLPPQPDQHWCCRRSASRLHLVGVARVRRIGVCVVRHVWSAELEPPRIVPAGDVHGHVGVDRILLGLRVGVGVLLGLADWIDVLTLAVTATARTSSSCCRRSASAVASGRLARVRRIGVCVVASASGSPCSNRPIGCSLRRCSRARWR